MGLEVTPKHMSAVIATNVKDERNMLLRLVPRQDPQPALYALYGRTRDRLRAGEPLAWTLRRFERDLLEALGVGFDFGVDGDGEPLDPAARYRIEPDHGPRRVRELRPG